MCAVAKSFPKQNDLQNLATKELLADIIYATSHAFRWYIIIWSETTSHDNTSSKMNKFKLLWNKCFAIKGKWSFLCAVAKSFPKQNDLQNLSTKVVHKHMSNNMPCCV